jgi:pilus assembly protein CpaD
MSKQPFRLWPLLALSLAASLAACETSADFMGMNDSYRPPPPLTARDHTQRLTVSVPRNGEIAELDWRRIDAFLLANIADRPDALHLTIAGDPALGTGAIARRAAALGVRDDRIEFAPPNTAPGAGSKVELIAKVYVAVLPNCPITDHLDTIDGDNKLNSDWACATTSNLELMVADPRDLVRGESGGETDSALTTAAITRLQTDKVKKLESSTTTAAPGAGGTGQ